MILLIDQGNSALKWCCYDKNSFTASTAGVLNELVAFAKLNDKAITDIFISCVKNQEQVALITHSLEQNNISQPIRIASTSANFGPLINAYNQFEQLGVDRWLGMIAIWKKHQSGFILVDAGSALTLDIIDNSGKHLGGHIIPGLSMQTKLLIRDTDGIAVASNHKAQAYIPGHSTTEAVLNGCLTNLCSYIDNMYQRYGDADSLPLFLTGGDAIHLTTGLTTNHQLEKELVLEGLYYSLTSNK
ncbi:MAG: type III pantothenate kinase [Enterobacterales bacterium]|jgi:type III pantothenate kinase